MKDADIDEIAKKYSGMGGIEDYRSFARDIAKVCMKTYSLPWHDEPTVRTDAVTLNAEVTAWRERFKQHEYRPQDDCIALRS